MSGRLREEATGPGIRVIGALRARGCPSHIFTDPACAECTANQARRGLARRKLNPRHPLNALDGERE